MHSEGNYCDDGGMGMENIFEGFPILLYRFSEKGYTI